MRFGCSISNDVVVTLPGMKTTKCCANLYGNISKLATPPVPSMLGTKADCKTKTPKLYNNIFETRSLKAGIKHKIV